MSIKSEITRIQNNVSSALSAVSEKGVTVPSGSNSDNLPALIKAIVQGGDGMTVTYIGDYVQGSYSVPTSTKGIIFIVGTNYHTGMDIRSYKSGIIYLSIDCGFSNTLYFGFSDTDLAKMGVPITASTGTQMSLSFGFDGSCSSNTFNGMSSTNSDTTIFAEVYAIE